MDVCEEVWCVPVSVFVALGTLTPFAGGRKQREQVRGVGEKFFRGINEEKQSYVKVGGKLLKKKKKQLLKKKQATISKKFVFRN